MNKQLKTFNGKVCCPECLEGANGYIFKALINTLNSEIYICDECEAVWGKKEDITRGVFREFEEFMKQHNLPPLWNELRLEEQWYKKNTKQNEK
jgi:hypothetical protein